MLSMKMRERTKAKEEQGMEGKCLGAELEERLRSMDLFLRVGKDMGKFFFGKN